MYFTKWFSCGTPHPTLRVTLSLRERDRLKHFPIRSLINSSYLLCDFFMPQRVRSKTYVQRRTAKKATMHDKEMTFVIPTYRLREVGQTIEEYDEHFWRNGHSVRMIVFDDSSPANQEKYYSLLEQTKTHNELFYVGPKEKEQFLTYINERLRDKRLEGLVRNLFRPSYGGNRNYTLMYTLGGLMVSADDDMRPYTLMEHSHGISQSGRGLPRTDTPDRRERIRHASPLTFSPRSRTCSVNLSVTCRTTMTGASL